jgi:hypothetical protein
MMTPDERDGLLAETFIGAGYEDSVNKLKISNKSGPAILPGPHQGAYSCKSAENGSI